MWIFISLHAFMPCESTWVVALWSHNSSEAFKMKLRCSTLSQCTLLSACGHESKFLLRDVGQTRFVGNRRVSQNKNIKVSFGVCSLPVFVCQSRGQTLIQRRRKLIRSGKPGFVPPVSQNNTFWCHTDQLHKFDVTGI